MIWRWLARFNFETHVDQPFLSTALGGGRFGSTDLQRPSLCSEALE